MLRKSLWVAFILICPLLTLAQDDAAVTITVETELCTGVEERMPVGMADQFPSDVGQVCLWSKVLGYTDETIIKHVWYFRGDEMATIELPVRGSVWRTYSYKTIQPEWSGDWVVKVIDADGNVLKAIPFKVGNGSAKTVVTEKMATEKKAVPTAEDMAPAVEKVKADAKSEVKKVEADAKSEIKKVEADAKSEIKKVEADAKSEVKEVKADAKTEVKEVKADTKTEVKKVEAEAKNEVKEVEAEAKTEVKKMKDSTNAGH